MITSLASNCDLKSTTNSILSRGMVRVPWSVLVILIVILGLLLSNPLVEVVLANDTSLVLWRLAPSIGTLGWLSSLQACS
jgi:hypothetical protein